MNSILSIAFATLLLTVMSAQSERLQLPPQWRMQVDNAIKVCIKEVSLPLVDQQKLKAKDLANPSQEFKCFINCFLEKMMGIKDGELQKDVIEKNLLELVGKERADIVLQKCGNIHNEDKCDTAANFMSCFESTNSLVVF